MQNPEQSVTGTPDIAASPSPRPGPSRRGLLGGAAAGALAVGALGLANAPDAAAEGNSRPVWPGQTKGFVRSRAGALWLGGDPFRYAGTNCYYLHYKSHYMIDSVLNDAKQMGLKVIRAWAFLDGRPADGFVFQPAPGVFDEDGFEALDYTVWKAGQLGLRLVLTLTNNWPDFGGMDQYVAWFGAAEHDDFYRVPAIKQAYKKTVRHVVGRRNRYTGLAYVEDPTVMTWELANEPRCRSDKSGNTLVAWADEMSQFVKSLAPKQLVAVGDEGFFGDAANADYPYSDYEGVAWRRLSTLKAVDYGTVHCYPDSWEGSLSQAAKVTWGTTWFADHIAEGHRLKVPVIIEEFGLKDTSMDLAVRNAAYTAWTGAVTSGGGAGDHVWILTARQDDGTPYPDYDGFRVVYPSSTAAVVTAHAAALAATA